MEEKNTNSAVETTTYEPVPAEQRRPWTSIMFIWMGSAICVPALMVGGMIGAGMKIGPAFLAKSYYVKGGFSHLIHMTAAHLW